MMPNIVLIGQTFAEYGHFARQWRILTKFMYLQFFVHLVTFMKIVTDNRLSC